MSFSRINSSAATLSKNRTEDSINRLSGMCATCIDGCIGMCEVGKSAYRGHEVLYPQPFGLISTASEKNYPVDYSHFSIMGTTTGAMGIEPDSDKAIFSSVNLETRLGHDKGIKMRFPMVISAMGSTRVASINWDGLAVGAALSGVIVTIGENVCGMDPEVKIKNGKVVKSPELDRRVKALPGVADRWLRGRCCPGKCRGYQPGSAGVRHTGARGPHRGDEMGTGRQGYRR